MVLLKNALNSSKATEQGTGLLGATKELFKSCWKTLTTKRPARIYIILCFFADFVARMTFTGDLGTIYPYLTLPKFEFTKVNVCLNNIAIVQLILDKNFIIQYTIYGPQTFLGYF